MATVQNIANTQTDISGHIYTNGNRLITAADVASVLQNMAVSYINRITDLPYLGLKAFSTTTTYAVGDCCVYSGALYQCTTTHTGAWNSADFTAIGGGGSYVPYTGATSDVDLGTYSLNAKSVKINGTGGGGHLGLKHQSASATASGSETALFANSSGDLAWKNDGNYLTTLESSGNTANRVYTFPNVAGTIALGTGGTNVLAYWSSTNVLTSLANGTGVLQNNGSGTLSWVTAMTNPMTTQGDMIYGGASGTPTRLALGTSGYILQAGATTPSWFNLFGTANTFTEAQSITKTQTTPLYGIVINNANGGNAWTNTGAGVQLTSNASTASIEYNNSTGTTVADKSLRYVSPNGQSFYASGTTGNTSYNFYWECVSSASYMRLLQAASSPRTLLELVNTNAGSTYVELRLNAGSSPVSLIGRAASLGIGVSPTSTFHVNGSKGYAYVAKTANYTLTISDYLVDCTANSFTITLPTAVSITGRVYEIVNSGAGTITIATTSSQTFANVTGTPTTLSLITALAKSIRVMSNGTNWIQLN